MQSAADMTNSIQLPDRYETRKKKAAPVLHIRVEFAGVAAFMF